MSQALDPSTVAPSAPFSAASLRRQAGIVFWLMWGLNFINYADRYALSAASPAIKADFGLSDFQVGLLATAFLFTYTVSILPLGLLADRIRRTVVIAGGVSFWSVVTLLTGFVPNYGALFATRAALGVGEGSYYPPGTSLLSSFFPAKDRAQVMARWSMGSLAGLAVGFIVGGVITQALGWRYAFYFFGPPGIVLALLLLRTKEPPRSAEDDRDVPELVLARAGWSGIRHDLTELWRIPTLRIIVAVQSLAFFALSSAVVFLPILLSNEFGISTGTIGILSGVVLVIGGVGGLFLGSVVADRLIQRFPGARVLTSGWAFLLAAPCFAAAVLAAIALPLPTTIRLYLAFVPSFLIATILLNAYSGPLTAAAQDVVAPARRAGAIGLTLMLSHLLGDLFAPSIVGITGDALKATVPGSPFLQSLGVTPTNSLGVALLIFCVPILIICGLVGIIGSRYYRPDLAAVRGE